MQCIYVISYVAMDPFIEKRKHNIELINEVSLMMVFYHCFCWTSFVSDMNKQFLMGYSFLFFLVVMLYFNVKNIAEITRQSYRRKKYLDNLHNEYKKYRSWKLMKSNTTYRRMRTAEW